MDNPVFKDDSELGNTCPSKKELQPSSCGSESIHGSTDKDADIKEYTVGVKKTVTFSFRSVPFERRPLLHVRRSVSVLLARASAIICWACFADVSKIKGQRVR